VSSGADDETVPRRFDNRGRHKVQVVHVENALDLSKKASQVPEITSCHPNQACDYIWEELFVWKVDADRCPFACKQMLYATDVPVRMSFAPDILPKRESRSDGRRRVKTKIVTRNGTTVIVDHDGQPWSSGLPTLAEQKDT
jgi:hypothetical protein